MKSWQWQKSGVFNGSKCYQLWFTVYFRYYSFNADECIKYVKLEINYVLICPLLMYNA